VEGKKKTKKQHEKYFHRITALKNIIQVINPLMRIYNVLRILTLIFIESVNIYFTI
jgi:hypothetical protein